MSRLDDDLDQIVKAVEQIEAYVHDLEKRDFLADKRTQQAVVLNLVVIGEAATRVSQQYEALVERYPEIPWKSMRGMRNRIAHGYFDIEIDVVWNTIDHSLPTLKSQLALLIDERARRPDRTREHDDG